MRKINFVFVILFISVSYAVAQKAKVQTAYNFYKEPYQQYDKAKEAIDEAILNEQSKGMAKTWYYRGLIYQSLYKNEKYGALCDNCLMTAFEAFQKANELEPGNEWAKEITFARIPFIANKYFQLGVEAFNVKDYKTALQNFETVQKITPGDTAVILNSAYSAERAGENAKAKMYYSNLIKWKYPDNNIYTSLSNLYKFDGDSMRALEVVREGRVIYPDSMNLILAEINLLLAAGRNEEASRALDAAIKKDPNNASLFLALGSVYDNLANPKDKNGKELPKPKNYTDYFTKAESAYKQGLAISPENFELNYNLGAMYFNQAAEMANKANDIKSTEEYNKAKVAFEKKFREAEPFLSKSLEKNPKKSEDDMAMYEGSLISLKQLYFRIGEMEKYGKIKAELDQLDKK